MVLACCLAVVFSFGAVALAAESEPKVGQSVGNVTFPPPLSQEDANYLGLTRMDAFSLQEIKSPYVLVEQFNANCPYCMAQAPVLNNLYTMVQQDAALKTKLKFLAVGQNNDENAVRIWKAFHKVPFPVLPDTVSTFGKALNFSAYPLTLVLDRSGRILFVHVGVFENAAEVLKGIKAVVK
ncbi:MAG: TlpA family protein disulfide reductase [Desulfobaccales bacterium]